GGGRGVGGGGRGGGAAPALGGGESKKKGPVGVGSERNRPLPFQAAGAPPHLTMMGGKKNDRFPPQIHFVQHIYDLLEIVVFISDRVQVVVVEDAPHVFAIRRDGARPAIPAGVVF